MNDSTRSMLHEVMEQQTLSITKAGIICQLNARTSILAAANPLESQWSKNKTIIDNINLPHTLLSRWLAFPLFYFIFYKRMMSMWEYLLFEVKWKIWSILTLNNNNF
jgi:hypothetical protein